MKRFGALMMAVLMVVMLTIPAFAAGSSVVFTITPSTNTAEYGDEIVFTVSVSGDAECKTIGYMPSYDKSVYELVSAEALMVVGIGGMAAVDPNFGGTAVIFPAATVPSGDVGSFTLKVIDGAATGASAVTVTPNAKNGSATISLSAGTAGVEVFDHIHDLMHVDAIAPACHYDGNIEYWWCTECETVWQDEALTQITNFKNVVLPAVGGEVTHVEAKAPSCYEEGNIEYWYCEQCEQVWQDEALTQLTNSKNVLIGVEHDVVHVDAVAAGCHYDGNIEYWWCTECETVWQDEALTQITNFKNVVVPAVGGDVVHFEAVEAACHYDGNIEYWMCYDCEQVWQDEALTQLTNIKNVVVPAVGGDVVHVEAKEASCYEEGNIEYWYCEQCEQVWQDEALTQKTNIKNVVIGITHDVVHVDAVEAACHYDGNIEYWYCSECETVWQDEALTQITNFKNVVVPAVGGDVVHMEAVEAACHYDGNIEHWICYECEQVWQDEALTQLTNIKNVVIPAIGGEVVHVEAKEATCYEEGNIEYWYCEDCQQVWQDEALTQLTNIKNVNLGVAAHEVEHVAESCYNTEYWYCEACLTYWADEELTQITNVKNVNKAEATHELEHVEETCYNTEYWFCSACETYWADEALTQITNSKNVIKAEPSHEVEHVEESCWNTEYWTCGICQTYWADEALTQITNSKNVIKANGHEVEHVAETCYNTEYWYCGVCETYWADEALTQNTNAKNVVKAEATHEVEHIAESCYNVEYWYCSACQTYWADEALTQITNSKNVIKAEATHEVEHVAESCYNVEYWYCSACETYWADEALTQITNSKNVIKAEPSHDLEHVEESCYNTEYWYCDICQTYWADEALTQITNSKNVIKAEPSHDLEHVAESCWNTEYWYCEICQTYWADEALTQITNSKNVIKAEPSHKVEHVEAKDPTCTETGNVEYWYCAECESVWADEECTQVTNVKNVTVAAKGHVFDKEGICTVCGAAETQTGDNAMIMVWVAVMALAAAAFVLVSKKRVA